MIIQYYTCIMIILYDHALMHIPGVSVCQCVWESVWQIMAECCNSPLVAQVQLPSGQNPGPSRRHRNIDR